MERYAVEFVGTMFLVLVVALSGGNPIAIGAVLVALVYMGGYISGGHYNPAVTLAVWKAKKIRDYDAQMYMISQVTGSMVGAVLYALIKGATFVPQPAADASLWGVFLTEFIFTFALASVVLNVAASVKVKGNHYYGLAIGAMLVAGIYAAGPISGAVFNPAVALGTMIVDITNLTTNAMTLGLYVLAQVSGGLLAAVFFKKTSEG